MENIPLKEDKNETPSSGMEAFSSQDIESLKVSVNDSSKVTEAKEASVSPLPEEKEILPDESLVIGRRGFSPLKKVEGDFSYGDPSFHPKIIVFGVGGAGGNALNRMLDEELEGIEFVAANTDLQALHRTGVSKCIQLGRSCTKGLGAGTDPVLGRQAAEESEEEIREAVRGAHLCFITGGMGGGTGTGASPVVAKVAREEGALTIGIVTMPFEMEGKRRALMAQKGLEELEKELDTLVVVYNQNLYRLNDKNTSVIDAFKEADRVLYKGVQGIVDVMVKPGLINLDFADVRAVIENKGKRALIGIGVADGQGRAVEAAEGAIYNPLLDKVSLVHATDILVNIAGGEDMKLPEVEEALGVIRDKASEDVNIVLGARHVEGATSMIVTVVATGLPDPNENNTLLFSHAQLQKEGGETSSFEEGFKGEQEELELPIQKEEGVSVEEESASSFWKRFLKGKEQ